jgi:hypothetical protein
MCNTAQIGGVPNSELNTLELEFLFLTNFDLHVKRQVRHDACSRDPRRAPRPRRIRNPPAAPRHHHP